MINYTDRGSTAKKLPMDVTLELALKEVKENPFTYDAVILKEVVMADSRWPADEGWVKVERKVEIIRYVSTEIDPTGAQQFTVKVHYVANIRTKQVDDFKIKEVLLNGRNYC